MIASILPASYSAPALVEQLLGNNVSTIVYGVVAIVGLHCLRAVIEGSRREAQAMVDPSEDGELRAAASWHRDGGAFWHRGQRYRKVGGKLRPERFEGGFWVAGRRRYSRRKRWQMFGED